MTRDETHLRATTPPFGQLLKHLRTTAELTQEELAEQAGVSARLVSDLERGVIQRPRRDTVRMLADGLGLTGSGREAFVAVARERSATTEVWAADTVPPNVGHNLPAPPTALVGREREVAAAVSLLRQPAVRLLTLTGPGGVGKTRLAIEVAARVADAFPGGVSFVDLAPVRDPALFLPTIAQALGVRASGEPPLLQRLVGILEDRCLLLVLDNCEHLVGLHTPGGPGAAPALANLLAACPALTALATSRQPLRIRAEREYPVTPLVLPDRPDGTRHCPSPDALAAIPAVELLVRRAEEARRGFALTPANARVMAEIAIRLDGLPLAIELAAARLKVLSPAALLAHLECRLALLTGGAYDLPARQQTLRATLDWSHDLLTPDEQRLFRHLAVFAGGFTLGAAEAVSREGEEARRREETISLLASSPSRLLDSLGSLVAQNLLRPLDSDDDDPRFGMLETIREYGRERLAAAGEDAETRQRHAAWCLELAERAEPRLSGPEQVEWFTRLDFEHDNLRAALGWAIERRHGELAMRLGGALRRFWNLRGHSDEGRRWLEQALALDDGVPPAARAKALLGLGVIAYRQGDYGRVATLEEALAIYRALGDDSGVATALCNLGLIAQATGDTARATAHAEDALAIVRRLGDQNRIGNQLENLGLAAYDQGDYARATSLLAESLALARAVGNRHSAAFSLNNLARVALVQGDRERAASLQQEALALWRLLGNKDGLAHCLENLARIAAARNEPGRTVRLFAAAGALRRRIGAPGRLIDRQANERQILDARTRLGEAAFAAIWEDGGLMSLDAAVAYALEHDQQTAAGDPRPTPGDD